MACRHSGRHVYVSLRCLFDCATIACTLKWGVALVGDYHYWCDAPTLGGPLTTRQPTEYSWMSDYPTPLTKFG